MQRSGIEYDNEDEDEDEKASRNPTRDTALVVAMLEEIVNLALLNFL